MNIRVEPVEASTSSPLPAVHILCCQPDPGVVALCGHVIKQRLPDWTDAQCVVCLDLADTDACPKYGVCKLETNR